MISALTLLLLFRNSDTHIHIMFHSKYLMERDEKAFSKNWDCFAGHKDRVHYHWELDFKVEKHDVLLVNEADAVMFKEALHFYEAYSATDITIVGFTATPYDTSKGGDGIDKKVLDELEFDLLY